MATQQVFGGLAVPRTFSLPAELSETLTEQARREDRPVSWIVRRALVSYLSGQQAVGGGTEDNSQSSR